MHCSDPELDRVWSRESHGKYVAHGDGITEGKRNEKFKEILPQIKTFKCFLLLRSQVNLSKHNTYALFGRSKQFSVVLLLHI